MSWSPAEELSHVNALLDVMVKRGVRRMRIHSVVNGTDLELELDPAAQLLNALEPAAEEPEATVAEKVRAGLCSFKGCKEKGGWLNQAYCKAHFQVAMSGRVA